MKLDKNGFATENSTITIYHTDAAGVYTHSTTATIAKGTGLTSRAYADEPPAAQDGFTIVRQKNGWTHIADLRGTTVYSTADGSEQTISDLGELPEDVTTTPRPSDYHTWNGTKWTLTTGGKKQRLDDAKTDKKAVINAWREQARHAHIDYNGATYQGDAQSQSLITSSVALFTAAGGAPEGFVWRDADNIDHPFTLADLVGLGAALATRTSTDYATAWALKAQVDAATTLTAVDAVEVPE